jgi:hypothetical protein
MRVDLRVPYAQKDAAKALGARWDAARKLWYVLDPSDLNAFADWLPEASSQQPATSAAHGAKVLQAQPPKSASAGGVFTGPKEWAPLCDCTALPWEDCPHSPKPQPLS